VSRFLGAVRAPALLAALLAAFAGFSVVQAQYQGDDLPANVLSASINGQPIDADDTPVITDPQPIISGQVAETDGTVAITVASDPITFVAATDAEGNFSAQVPVPLENGVHQLYFDGEFIGNFIIAAATPTETPPGTATPTGTATATATAPSTATPAPPATGAGNAGSGDWSLAGAGVVGLVVVGTVAAMYALRQRSNRA